MTLQDTTLNTSFDSGASLQRFDNPLSVQALPLRSVSSFAIASGGMFTDNASSNFAGVLSNPFDDARVYANGAVTLNGVPTFSGFGDGLTLGPTGRLQNVSAAIASSLKLGQVAQAITIDVPAYLVPTIGAVERTIDVSQFPLNGAADVAGAFGGLGTVKWTGGSLNLPDATVLKNLTIVVENGDVNFNGDRHLLENVKLIALNGTVNLADVQGKNLAVYAARSIHMNQAARFGGKSFLGTQNGDVIFNGATNTIGSQDYVKVVAHGDVIFNAAANTRGDFWSTEDFFANRESSIVGKIRAQQSITFNAHVNMIADVLQNINFPVKNQPAIGIIDTGFALNNPDIDYSRITNLKDWVGNDSDSSLKPSENGEHGTHTLGIIGAIQDNGIGIDGINGKAPIYISRATGSGKWSQALVEFLNRFEADASQPNPIVYLGFDLTQMNADGTVSTRTSLTLEERSALEYARQKGALIIVPAGNDGSVMSALGQAAQEFDNLVVVGAVDANGRTSYSSYGAGLTIMAPGGTIADPVLSTVGDGLGTMAGTSIAAAYAVGHISNVWAANPNLSYQQVIDIIKATALDIHQPGWDSETGAGVLDVAAAVELAQLTQATLYDPPATILPDTWDGAGTVLPLERPANWSTDFTGRIMATDGARVRAEPSINSRIITVYPFDTQVKFTRWTYGDRVTDIALNTPDERWYYDARYGGWIASAIVDGNAPGSTPLRPENPNPDPNPNPNPNPNPDPIPNIPINPSSSVYRNGKENPFANNWIGQCTWFAYGRMLETGLLPAGTKANGWFVGNAEAWRRDAARAGLAVNSRPTTGARGLVVWPPGVQGGHQKYGHVAFLEEVLPNGSIRISESNWSGQGVKTRILSPAQWNGLAFIPLEGVRSNPQFSSPPARPGQQREYRVRPGDTLSAIALRELGSASRWRELKKADGTTFSQQEAKSLAIGLSIYLPVQKSTPITNSNNALDKDTGETKSINLGLDPYEISDEYENFDGKSVKDWTQNQKLNAVVDHIKDYVFDYVKGLGESALEDIVSSFNGVIDEIKRFPNLNFGSLGTKLFDLIAGKVLGRTPIGRAVLAVGGGKSPSDMLGEIGNFIQNPDPGKIWNQIQQLWSDASQTLSGLWNAINKLTSDAQKLPSILNDAKTESDLDAKGEEFVEASAGPLLGLLANLIINKVGVKKGGNGWSSSLKETKKKKRTTKLYKSDILGIDIKGGIFQGKKYDVEIKIPVTQYPDYVYHLATAQNSGRPSVLTIDTDKLARNMRRQKSLYEYKKRGPLGDYGSPGTDMDEYPPAMFLEGGEGASVLAIPSNQNRSVGSLIYQRLKRAGLYEKGVRVKLTASQD